METNKFNQILNIVMIVIFGLILSHNAIAGVLDLPDSENQEGRIPASIPSFKFSGDNQDFPNEFSVHFSDNLYQRNRLIKYFYSFMYHLAQSKYFKSVVVGDEGWMFATADIPNFQGVTSDWTEEELDTIGQTISDIESIVTDQGITFLFVVAPAKGYIYPEYLPDEIKIVPGKPAPYQQLYTYLDTHYPHISTIDSYKLLLSHKDDDYLLYSKTDTHWNDYGAFFVIQAMIDQLNDQYPTMGEPGLDQFEFESVQISSHLVRQISMKNQIFEDGLNLHPAYEPTGVQIEMMSAHQSNTFENLEINKPRAIILRDSFFGVWERQTIAEHFGYVLFVQRNILQEISLQNLIAQEKPDIVILQMSERGLENLLGDDFFIPFSTTNSDSLELHLVGKIPSSTTPVFTWPEIADAIGYRLIVTNASTDEVEIQTYLVAQNFCSEGTCVYNRPKWNDLPTGTYSWTISPQLPTGYGRVLPEMFFDIE